jgi:N-acyl amino acid synthase FeeM
MNPSDLSAALLYGIPVVLYASVCQGFDSILTRRAPARREAAINRIGASTSPSDPHAALHISIASTAKQVSAAKELVRRRYAWRGYGTGESDLPSEREITFVVSSTAATLGTLTLRLDGPQGLSAEVAYGDVIESFRAAGHRVCELTRLALAEDVESRTVLSSLFSLAHAVGRTLHDVTHVFIEVNPRHVAFYSRVLGFVVEASGKLCERVRAPSTLLQIEIEELEKRLGLIDLAALMQPLAEAA